MTSRSLSIATVLTTVMLLGWGFAAQAENDPLAVNEGQVVDSAPLEDGVEASSPDDALAESSDATIAEAGEPVEPSEDPATSVWGSEPVPAAPSEVDLDSGVNLEAEGDLDSGVNLEAEGDLDSGVSFEEEVDRGAPAATTPVAADTLKPTVPQPVAATGRSARGAITTTHTPTKVSKGMQLGPIGYDAEGHKGRVHTVSSGNTLWAIADAYLGTPWVWPSIWSENDEIENPHLIVPGDLLWITSSEMRRVTPEEAREMIASEPQPAEVAAAEVEDLGDGDAFVLDGAPAEIPQTIEVAMPQALNQVPVSVPSAKGDASETGRSIRVSSRESMSFVTSETLEAASSLVGSPAPRIWLADGDRAFIGLGEGEVDAGDQFTIFRDAEEVRDVDGSLLGYHVEILGWLEVNEVHSETALSTVRHSVSEIQKGDRLVPRIRVASTVPIRHAPDGIEGHIIYLPNHRTVAGSVDYVYLNLGSIHGLEVGTALEVFTEGVVRPDEVRRTDVQTPDRPVADLVVVAVKPDSAVAFVTHTSTELQRGDVVRSGTDRIASRR